MSLATTVVTTEYAHIVRPANGQEGEAHLAGHRIRVRDVIAARDRGGFSAEEISATVYPHLTLAEVYAAFAYYEDHRGEIDLADHREADVADEFARRFPDAVRDLRPKNVGD